MNQLDNFYRDLYGRTGGFVFNWPIAGKLRIGDFFTLRPGGIGVVGNIYESYFQLDLRNQFLDQLSAFQSPVLAPFREENNEWQIFEPANDVWSFKDQCQTNFETNRFLLPHKHKLEAADVNTYTTKLGDAGSYFFTANDVVYVRMPHFIDIHKEVIRRLTTEFYNFNTVYLVTEVAMAEEFSLGISRDYDAEMVFSKNKYFSGDLLDMLALDIPLEVEKVNGMAVVKLKQKGGVLAFKAKKMSLSVKAQEVLINHIYNSSDPEIRKYAVEMINNDLFHLFPSIEINPGNANEFFSWYDMSLEDTTRMVESISF